MDREEMGTAQVDVSRQNGPAEDVGFLLAQLVLGKGAREKRAQKGNWASDSVSVC